jgi:hypothetical protein
MAGRQGWSVLDRIADLLAVTERQKTRLARRRMNALRESTGSVVEDGGRRLFEWGADGTVDKDAYRRAQTIGNQAKLTSQWVQEDHVRALADYVNRTSRPVARGVCHGTRRGNEQMWFRTHLEGVADVFGTEISDTATQFPHTIQWDFHEQNPEWVGAFDLVYSNSWDHAYDPAAAFRCWCETLAPGGLMLLDHSKGHLPDMVDALDPFGTTEEGLVELLDRECAQYGRVVDVISAQKDGDGSIRTIVFRANGERPGT